MQFRTLLPRHPLVSRFVPRFVSRFTAALCLGAALCGTAAAATNVGVSIQIGDPGFYGQLDISAGPRPQLVYAQPVIIQHVPVRPAPIYLRVPPGHEKNWRKHCGRYNACGRPVYFVRDSWYSRVYAPDYRRRHGPPPRHDDHGHGHDDHHDNHGHGHDRGHGGR